MNLNIVFFQNFNKNYTLKSQKKNANYLTNIASADDFKNVSYPKNYYLNKIPFTAKRTSANKLAERIGIDNFPSCEIFQKLKELGKSSNFSLYDIHIDYYRGLLDCATLDEVKEKYPEFTDVIDAKNIDVNSLDKNSTLYKIFVGKIKNIDINTLSLDILKRYYAKLETIYDQKKYWELAPSSVLKMMRALNIKTLSRGYNTAIHITEETRKKHAEASVKNWANPEFKNQVSQAIKETFQKPDSKIHSKEHRAELSNATKEAYRNPDSKFNSAEYRAKRSKIAQELWERPEYSEKQAQTRKTDEYKSRSSQSSKEAHKNPDSRYHSSEYKAYRSQISQELWQTPEYIEKQIHSRSTDEYKAKKALITDAKKEAFKRHPEVTAMMSKVAEDFPQLGVIIKKQGRNEELSQEEKRYKLGYFAECNKVMPDYMKIVGEEQHKILVEWGLFEE